MRKNIYYLLSMFFYVSLMVFAVNFPAIAAQKVATDEVIDTAYTDEVYLVYADIKALKVHNLTRISITNPDVIDVLNADEQELLILGKEVGETALFLWDDHGKRTIIVRVFGRDLEMIKSRIETRLKRVDVYEVDFEIDETEGKIAAKGILPEHKKGYFDRFVGEPYGDYLINLVDAEKIEDLIQLDLQVSELNTTLSEAIGIDWATGGTTGIHPVYSETVPTFDGSVGDYFKIGDFRRSGQLQASIEALISEGKGRVLSKPKITVINGEAASFLVGGEIPIRTTTFSDTGASQENVSFKSFGISMSITPTIKTISLSPTVRKEKIDVVMSVEVSEVDASTATAVSEDVAFSTRSASTRLLLDDGQTIVLAGFIKHSESETRTKIPLLGDIPVLGAIFRRKSQPTADQDQEVAISFTPHRIRDVDQEAMKSNDLMNQANIPEIKTRNARLEAKESYQKAAPYYSGIPHEMREYVQTVQQKISHAIKYPLQAKNRGLEGTVKLGMLILKDGTLAYALIKESSGHDIFDDVALNTAKEMAPYLEFPSETDLQELSVIIPVVYSLKRN